MDESGYNVSVLEVTIQVRSVTEQDCCHPDLQVIMGSKYISRNSRGEVATELFLVRAVECNVRNEDMMKLGDKRTDFVHQPFVWHMRSQSWSHEGDRGGLSPLSEGTRLYRERHMLKGMK